MLETLKKKQDKDNIIDQLLLDLQKMSTQSTRNPQPEISVDHQELASMEYNINPLNLLKTTSLTQNLAIQKKKGHVT